MSSDSSVSKAPKPQQAPDYRLWVNEARTVLVTLWASGVVEVATRDTPAHTWGPPVICDEEKS